MKILIFLTTFLVLSTSGDQWGLLHFSRTASELFRCLDEGNTGTWNELNLGRFKHRIIEHLSHRFSGRSVPVVLVNRTLTNLLDDLALNRTQIPRAKLALMEALMNCIDQPDHYGLPHFVNENPEIADLLNHILVDSRSLNLSTLCNYARSGLTLLQTALRITDSSHLNDLLRSMWTRRSVLYFDEDDFDLPYIRHFWSSEGIYTTDDPSLFSLRSHRAVLYNYYYPHRTPISGSHFYYEIRENLFFRAIFFYLELVERGIVGPDGDCSSLSEFPDVPEDALQILHSLTAYNRYFETRRIREFGYSNVPCSEPELIVLLWSQLKSTGTTTAATSGTFSFTETSSTPGYEGSKKGKRPAGGGQVKKGSAKKWLQEHRNPNNYGVNFGPGCSKDCYGYFVGPEELQAGIFGLLQDDVQISDTIEPFFFY